MIIHEETQHISQKVQSKSGTRVDATHMKRFNFDRWEMVAED